jgi:arylsulfatase A-like enzyme
MPLVLVGLVFAGATRGEFESAPDLSRPNVIVIYADDLGYGDIGSYGAVGVETPNIDRLARQGIRFTDAHATAATCTPSRYSLLTGEYGFRSQAAILPGDAPALIRPGKPTLASLLQKEGYATAVVGKWHLGLGDGNVDWNKAIRPGPLDIGFDYSFLLPATGDRVPTVYVEGDRVAGLDPQDPIRIDYGSKVGDRPTGEEHPERLRYGADPQHSNTIVNGISRIGYMAGGEQALWVDEEFADIFTQKALGFIRENKHRPFFLFHSYHDIHVPRLPHERFLGKSQMGWRGDAIVQMDWMTGQIIAELEKLGIAERTLVIFTSDNGPVLDDGYADRAVELLGEHRPSGPLRGGKYSAFEAGARVPTIAWWPGRVEPGESDALISQVDLYASIAALVGIELARGEAVDSQNVLPALLGEAETAREFLFKESAHSVSLRKGRMKFIPAYPRDKPLPDLVARKNIEPGVLHEDQVYDLSRDIGETRNIAADNEAFILEMRARMERILGSVDVPESGIGLEQ